MKRMMLMSMLAAGSFMFSTVGIAAERCCSSAADNLETDSVKMVEAVSAEQENITVEVDANDAAQPKKVIVPKPSKDSDSVVQFGIWFNFPGYTKRNDVNGFRLGLPFSGTSAVSGFDLSLLGSHIRNLDGLQMSSLYSGTSGKSDGVQLSLGACLNNEVFNGVQVSLFNKGVVHRGWQVGLVNLDEQADGVQFSLVNVVDVLKGFHAGIVNVANRSMGPQIGIFNYAGRGSFQLGLFNVNTTSRMPFMLLFNFSK